MEEINNWQARFVACQYSNRLLDRLVSLNSSANQKVDIVEVTKAIYYARKYHGEQKRQSGEPFYSHPIEVANMFAEYTGKFAANYYRTDLIVTAILHDTIEDTLLTKEMISGAFGANVANKVDDLTRIKINKKITAAESLNVLFSQNKQDVLLVKLFDRLHNFYTVQVKSREKVEKITEETLLYFVPLAMYLEADVIKQELINIAYKNLAIKPFKEQNLLEGVNDSEDYCLPSPAYQSVIHLIKSQDLQEA